VGAADDVDEDQGVEGDEGSGPGWVDAAGGGEAGNQVGRRQQGSGRYGLDYVDGGLNWEPGERVGRQGEERAVGAGGFGPGDLGESGVRGSAQRWVDVGVEAVQDAEAGVVDIAVDVV